MYCNSAQNVRSQPSPSPSSFLYTCCTRSPGRRCQDTVHDAPAAAIHQVCAHAHPQDHTGGREGHGARVRGSLPLLQTGGFFFSVCVNIAEHRTHSLIQCGFGSIATAIMRAAEYDVVLSFLVCSHVVVQHDHCASLATVVMRATRGMRCALFNPAYNTCTGLCSFQFWVCSYRHSDIHTCTYVVPEIIAQPWANSLMQRECFGSMATVIMRATRGMRCALFISGMLVST